MTKGTAAAVPFAEVEKVSPTADEPPRNLGKRRLTEAERLKPASPSVPSPR